MIQYFRTDTKRDESTEFARLVKSTARDAPEIMLCSILYNPALPSFIFQKILSKDFQARLWENHTGFPGKAFFYYNESVESSV